MENTFLQITVNNNTQQDEIIPQKTTARTKSVKTNKKKTEPIYDINVFMYLCIKENI